MKSYIINLDRNPERMQAMAARFDELGLAFERFPAVDGAAITEAQFQAFTATRSLTDSGDSHSNGKRRWSPARMGCFLSHYAVWTKVAQSTDRYTAIFEDDMHISDSVKAMLQNDAWIPQDSGIVRLESTFNRVMLAPKSSSPVAGRDVMRIMPSPYDHCWPVCTGALILERETARRLIAEPEEFHAWVDLFLFAHKESRMANRIVTYQVCPAPCVQDKYFHADRSDIVFKSNIETGTPVTSRVAFLPSKLATLRNILLGYKRIGYSA